MEAFPSHERRNVSSLPCLYHRYPTSVAIAFTLIITLNLAIIACIFCKRIRRAISNTNSPHDHHSHQNQVQVHHRVHQVHVKDLDQDQQRDKLEAIPIFAFGHDTSYYASSSSTSASTFEYTSCAVCLGEYVDGEVVRMLPKCMHMFHKDCIDQWLRFRSSNCPLCRDKTIDDSLSLTTITITAN